MNENHIICVRNINRFRSIDVVGVCASVMQRKRKLGGGIINKIIDRLPLELHVPGYQFCGPGTKLEKRLNLGQTGINGLDSACREHDIAYSTYKDDVERRKADKKLASAAWDRVKSSDSSFGEKSTALFVSAAMKAKTALSKIGRGLSGCRKSRKRTTTSKKKSKKSKPAMQRMKKPSKMKKKKCCFKKMVSHTKRIMKNARPRSSDDVLNTALAASKKLTQTKSIAVPRVIRIPKTGGILPLVPIFAGLSALGSIAGGAASIIRAIKGVDDGKKAIKKGATAVVVGKSISGGGLYLKPYGRTGLGLYLNPKNY